MKKFTIVFIFFFLLARVYAQKTDFNNYTPVKSRGILPKEFSTSSLDKYLEAKQKIDANKGTIEKEAIRDYELETSFAIDDIFHSGRVIFNDTISNYVNMVMQKLMDQRETKKDARVFVLSSSVVNAFSTDKGIIFISMGLLARMHDEAELAFVLAHEYIHYVKKHNIKGYIENTKAKYSEGEYYNTSIDDKYLRRANFSREQETEADELGFELFSKTNYDIHAASTVLNTIRYYYLPFDSVLFRPSYFEKGSFHIPENYFNYNYARVDAEAFEKDSVSKDKSKKNADDDDDGEDSGDRYSTHPSTGDRIENVEGLIMESHQGDNRSFYLVSEEAFKYTRKLCRFEIPRINLLDGDYEFAMYQAMALLQDEPKSVYLKKVIAKALYSMAKYGNAKQFNAAHIQSKNAQGHFQQLVNLMDTLNAQGTSAAAMNYCWQLKKENPDDIELRAICSSMMRSIVYTYENNKKRVFRASYSDTLEDNSKQKKDSTVANEAHKNSRDDNAVADSKKADATATDDDEEEDDEDDHGKKINVLPYFKNAFVFWFESDTAFANLYQSKLEEKKAQNKIHHMQVGTKYLYVLPVNTSDTKYIKDNKVILLDPFYLYYTHSTYYDNGEYRPIESEINKTLFTESLRYVAGKTLKDCEVLDQDELMISEAEKLSEITILRDCLMENLDKRGIGLVSTDLSQVKQIAKKYNSTNLILTGVISEKVKRLYMDVALKAGFISGPFYPFILLQCLSSGYRYTIFTVFYNTDIDDFRVSYYQVNRGKDTESSLTANLYQMFSRLRTY